MTNADDFRPDDPHEYLQHLQERIDSLNKQLAIREREIREKDILIKIYWDTIQSMRMVNRLKRIATPWNHPDASVRNFQKSNSTSFFKKKNGTKICIKSPVYNWKVAHTWGDFHFAIALRKQLLKLGYDVIIQTLDEWYNDADKDCDIILVLRGLSKYKRNRKALHIMWNISHPADVSIEEYDSYDHVFIASKLWAEEIKSRIGEKVTCLLQCTDPDIFKRALFPVKTEVLFVGNSKGIFRPIIKDLLPTDIDLSIYGNDWENIIDRKFLKGTFIDHHKLYKYYSGAKILLNDHWDDMRRHGFISNRIFDGLACGALIISDNVEGLNEILGSSIITYDTSSDLNEKIRHYIKPDMKSKEFSERGRKLVLQNHTFKLRVDEIRWVIGNDFNL